MSESDDAALPTGSLGPYRLLRRLGAGGMAEVYLARASGASGFEKLVALKVLRPELADDAQSVRSLIEEARLGARLSHRNLLPVHDLGVAEGVYYLRLDYVDGGDLHRLAATGRPTMAHALLIAEQVAAALEMLHGVCDEGGRPLGLVHRDVSPTNILLSRAGDVKLADYGVAKATALAAVTRANVRKGKYAYMSPEQVEGQPLTPSSDLFALGATLTELLLGFRPFEGATPHETMQRICAPTLPDELQRAFGALDGALAGLLERCLARDPAARFEDAARLGRALRERRRALDPAASLATLAQWVCQVVEQP